MGLGGLAFAGEPDAPLPACWNSESQGRKPVVRSQGSAGTCWALTAASALEAALLPEESLVFSGEHMALRDAYSSGLREGGDYVMLMAYLSSWFGPVTEEEDPDGDGVSPEGLSPAVHVQEIQMLLGEERDVFKKKILECGGVQTSLYMNLESTSAEAGYYNASTAAYYCPQEREEDHDVLLVGWDDAFPREAFAQDPGSDGAFLCLNTWGEEFGEDGIFYISYEDANLVGNGLAYTGVEAWDNYKKIYQNDTYGWLGQQGYGRETCWFSNVYTAEADERLEALGFYAVGKDTSYELYLIRDFEGPDSFENRILLQAGSFEQAGYYTVNVKEPRELKKGERFAVAVKIITPGEASPVAVEYRADEYSQGVELEGKEGYLSPDGERWEQTETNYGSNVCLKAFTS